MASLQRFTSHGETYWRIVESYRRKDGHPTVRVLAHLGKVDQLLSRLQGEEQSLRVRSVSCGAVDALYALAVEFDVASQINLAIAQAGGKVRVRDGLTVGDTLVAGAIGRLCHPSSKRAFAAWAEQTTLPQRMGFQARALTSQHFWDQMNAMPVIAIEPAEEAIVASIVKSEALRPDVLAYDTTNFFTYIATTNERAKLPQRGHNKQRRHDLRQMGLALVVSEDGQIPLGHTLYQGQRPDVKTFPEVLAPLRRRLRKLVGEASQLTLVFDQGSESKDNLAELRDGGEPVHYVTALKPSHHRQWLREVATQLAPVKLSNGEQVRAYRTRRQVHGVEQTVVVVFSQCLYEGQRRGLDQSLQKVLQEIACLSPHPRGGVQGAKKHVARICNRQYVRQVLDCEVVEKDGQVIVTPRVDEAARHQLEQSYFGLRVLTTNREDWTTQQIVEAYRGQSRVERAFRDLKDPWVCAFRPQFHWTDQKLLVHAFMAMLSLLLGRVLLRRAQQRAQYRGTLRGLVQQLTRARQSTVIRTTTGRGRPRVTEQPEECEDTLVQLVSALGRQP